MTQQQPKVPPPWPTLFHREAVRTWIEEVTGEGMSVDDSLPDTLVATAQALGALPLELKLWVYDQPKSAGWTGDALTTWCRRNGFNRVELAAIPRCGHCGRPAPELEAHICEGPE